MENENTNQVASAYHVKMLATELSVQYNAIAEFADTIERLEPYPYDSKPASATERHKLTREAVARFAELGIMRHDENYESESAIRSFLLAQAFPMMEATLEILRNA